MKLFKNKLSIIFNLFRNKSLGAFLICVLLALIFWFLNTFDKSYNSSIFFSVKFINLPKDKVLLSPPPDDLHILINASGWDIFKIKRLQKEFTIEVDLEKYVNKDYILTNDFRKDIKRQSFNEVKIVNITPDKISLEMQEVLKKVVPIKADLKVSFKKQYGLAGPITINPSKVLIWGPESVVVKVDTVFTEKLILTDLSEKISKQLKLLRPVKNKVELDVYEVYLNIPAEEFTEGKFTLPININKSINESLMLIPDKAVITYQTAISNFSIIDTNSFNLYVDYIDTGIDKSSKLEIKCNKNFDYIYSVRISPEYVDYIIEK